MFLIVIRSHKNGTSKTYLNWAWVTRWVLQTSDFYDISTDDQLCITPSKIPNSKLSIWLMVTCNSILNLYIHNGTLVRFRIPLASTRFNGWCFHFFFKSSSSSKFPLLSFSSHFLFLFPFLSFLFDISISPTYSSFLSSFISASSFFSITTTQYTYIICNYNI